MSNITKTEIVGVALTVAGIVSTVVVYILIFGTKTITSGTGPVGNAGPVGPPGKTGAPGSIASGANATPGIQYGADGTVTIEGGATFNADLTVNNDTINVTSIAANNSLRAKQITGGSTLVTTGNIVAGGYVKSSPMQMSGWTIVQASKQEFVSVSFTKHVDFSNPPKIQVLAVEIDTVGVMFHGLSRWPVSGNNVPCPIRDITNMGNTDNDNGFASIWLNPTTLELRFCTDHLYCRGWGTGACVTMAYIRVILHN